MRLKEKLFVLAGVATCVAFSASAEEHRQLGAHVHGHGRLNIAIENKTVSIELEAPGADIAGFEHEASTPEQKATIEKAKATLANGLALFTPPSEAQCTQTSSKVAIEAEHGHEHEHHADHEHEHHAEGAKHDDDDDDDDDHDGHGKEGHHHSEFHAEYAFTCAEPSRFTSLTFGYFKAFPNGQELDISLISPKGQNSFEVKRDNPSLDLTGNI